jgi:predicted permease
MTMETSRPRPPRLARLLLWVLPLGERRADVEADVTELFAERVAERGVRVARRRFYRDVLSILLRARRSGRARPRAAFRPLAGLSGDLRHASRLVRRYPALIAAAILSLGLAIGVATAVFSVLNGTWLKWYRSADSSQVRVWRQHRTGASATWAPSELFELRRRATSVTLEGRIASDLSFAASAGGGDRERVRVHFVTGTYLATFGARAATGRLVEAADDRPGAVPVAVLDHLFWRRQLGADRSVVGRTVWIGGSPFAVIGIADRDFAEPWDANPAVWVPLPAFDRVSERVESSGAAPRVLALGRLTAAATQAQAEGELTALVRGLAPAGDDRPATGVELGPTSTPEEIASARLITVGVLSVMALVLLLACANLSNLLLAGAASRQREIGVRLALGAGHGRIVRQLITESVLLGAAAVSLGFVFAGWFSPVLAVYMGLPGADVDPDARVYAFLAVALVLSGLAAGLAPARYGARGDLTRCLKGARAGARTSTGWFRSALVGFQAAASIMLVVLAALFVRSLLHITWLDPGFDVDRLLVVSADLPRVRATPDDDQRAARHWDAALARVRAMPGVERAALAELPPFGFAVGDPEQTFTSRTDSGYFSTVGLRVLRGRLYTETEVRAGEPVAVLSEGLARRFWGEEDPLGASLGRVLERAARLQIIGIVNDARTTAVEHVTPIVYVPGVTPRTQLVIRTNEPQALAGVVREALAALSPDIQTSVMVVADRFDREFQQPRRLATLATGVAAFALGLATVGLVGVTAFVVRQRTREIGIRMAMGARPADVIRGVIRDGLRPVAIGLIAGLVVALLTAQVVAGLLYGVSARDPVAISVAVVILLAAATAALVLPARRAALVDPAEVLRES